MRVQRVPDVVIRRMAIYLRILQQMDLEDDMRFISSQELGERAGVTPAQVRKDLALFGEFGKQGVGYQARNLKEELKKILKADRDIGIGVIGAGELGIALARYNKRRFELEDNYPFQMKALFDNDPAKIGKDIEGIPIFDVNEIGEKTPQLGLSIAIITVPAGAAQDVANLCVKAGIKAILNFAPTKLVVPEDVRLNSADVSLDLQQLAYHL